MNILYCFLNVFHCLCQIWIYEIYGKRCKAQEVNVSFHNSEMIIIILNKQL